VLPLIDARKTFGGDGRKFRVAGRLACNYGAFFGWRTSGKFFDAPRIFDSLGAMKRFVHLTLILAGCGLVALRAEEPSKIDGYERVGFDRLASFAFTPPEADPAKPDTPPPSGANQIPDKIKALDQQKVAVTGFMLPIKMDGSLVKEFLLVKDPMLCCYGVMPKVNEWIVVKMVGSGVKPLMDIPITFEGKLRVGEMYDNGYLTGLYLLEGERQAETKS
jgi:hypothetical protein